MSTLFYEVAFVSLVASSLQQKAKSDFLTPMNRNNKDVRNKW